MGEGQAANEEPQRLSVAGGLDHGACLGHGKHHATLTAPGRKLCKKSGIENPPHPIESSMPNHGDIYPGLMFA